MQNDQHAGGSGIPHGRVWTWQHPGAPLDLRLERRALPIPGPREVVVANRAIGLNPVDWKVIAQPPAGWEAGHVPGVDGAGTIMAVGADVTLRIGARVAYHQDLGRDGSFADFTCVEARILLPVPDALSDIAAAALPCPGLTADQAASKIPGGIGRDVLVTGAGGAVGLLLAQLGIARGWRVWATAAPRHHDMLLDLGVTGVFDYRDAAWSEGLAAGLGPRRLFAMIDTVDSAAARHLAATMLGYNGHLAYVMYREETLPAAIFTTAVSVHEIALNSIHGCGAAADWRDWQHAGARLMADAATGRLRLPPIVTDDFATLPTVLAGLRDGTAGGKRVITLNPQHA